MEKVWIVVASRPEEVRRHEFFGEYSEIEAREEFVYLQTTKWDEVKLGYIDLYDYDEHFHLVSLWPTVD